ncbi:MAG TPA: response regulator transcription factor [Puia sp.]|nr:response regulator transcription factor [Puia sp.]
MKKLSFMIVDDHEVIRWSLHQFLSGHENYEVIAQTGDSTQALTLATEKRPDFIFLDINLKPANGFEVLQQVRKLSPLSKVIGFSMHTEIAYAKKMIRLGARGYLTKNSPMPELREAIEAIMHEKIYLCRELKDALSMQIISGDNETPDLNILSEREMQVVGLLREGHSSKTIGAQLYIAANTVEAHRANILKKLKVKNSVALMYYLRSAAFEG